MRLLLLLALLGDGDPAPADLAAASAIRAVDLRKDLTYLASDELEGRATPSAGQAKAAEYLAARFAELKLEPGGAGGTYFQPVDLRNMRKKKSEPPASMPEPAASGPARPSASTACNVVAVLRGTKPDSGAVVFSAHYDHLGRRKPEKGTDDIYNGADDDGSGTVTVLALARAFTARKEKPERTIVFACFTGEESGGLGSRAYVNAPAVPLEKTLCDVNLEMLGRTHDVGPKRTWVTGYDLTTLGPILARGARAAGVEIFADPYPEQMYYMRSDNMSFVRKGVIGQSLSAGSNHPDYHTPRDEVAGIDFENLEALARGIYLGSSLIASGAETPKATGKSLLPTGK